MRSRSKTWGKYSCLPAFPRRWLFAAAILTALVQPGLLGRAEPPNQAEEPAPKEHAVNLHPPAPVPISVDELDASIRKGLEFLLNEQNKNGSWGSAERTKDLNIYAPVPGAHQAFPRRSRPCASRP